MRWRHVRRCSRWPWLAPGDWRQCWSRVREPTRFQCREHSTIPGLCRQSQPVGEVRPLFPARRQSAGRWRPTMNGRVPIHGGGQRKLCWRKHQTWRVPKGPACGSCWSLPSFDSPVQVVDPQRRGRSGPAQPLPCEPFSNAAIRHPIRTNRSWSAIPRGIGERIDGMQHARVLSDGRKG